MSKNSSTSRTTQEVYIYCDMSKKSNFLGEGSFKQVFLGIGRLNKDKDKDKDIFCKIYDNKYYNNKEYAIITYFDDGPHIEKEMKEESDLNKYLNKVAPKLYDVVHDFKSSKKNFFISDVCESISRQLDKYIINNYLDLDKFLKYVKKIYFESYLTIYYALKKKKKILLDLKFDNLCYIKNRVKLLDLDKTYVMDKNDSIKDNIYLTYVNILLLTDTIGIVYYKFIEFLGKEIRNLKNTKFLLNEINNLKKKKCLDLIKKYNDITDSIANLFDNYFTGLIKKNLSITNINEFQNFFNEKNRDENIAFKKYFKKFIDNYGSFRLNKILQPKNDLVYKIDDLNNTFIVELEKCYEIDINVYEEQVKFENKLTILRKKYETILNNIQYIDQQFRLSLFNFFKNPELYFKDSIESISDFFKLYIELFGKNKSKYSRKSNRTPSIKSNRTPSRKSKTTLKKIYKSI